MNWNWQIILDNERLIYIHESLNEHCLAFTTNIALETNWNLVPRARKQSISDSGASFSIPFTLFLSCLDVLINQHYWQAIIHVWEFLAWNTPKLTWLHYVRILGSTPEPDSLANFNWIWMTRSPSICEHRHAKPRFQFHYHARSLALCYLSPTIIIISSGVSRLSTWFNVRKEECVSRKYFDNKLQSAESSENRGELFIPISVSSSWGKAVTRSQ